MRENHYRCNAVHYYGGGVGLPRSEHTISTCNFHLIDKDQFLQSDTRNAPEARLNLCRRVVFAVSNPSAPIKYLPASIFELHRMPFGSFHMQLLE